MKPGVKPIDFATAVKRGKRRTDRHGTEKTQLDLVPPPGPASFPAMPRKVFGEIGRREWRRIKQVLQHSGIVTEADRAALIQYVLLYERMLDDPKSFTASDHNALRLLCESLSLSPPGRGRFRNLVD